MEDLSGMRHHLMCPISLQPMQDPVTAPTGITYDRRAIERWLAAGHATCPVTGQPLALADLTPNHTLRRLIQSWRPRSSTPPAQEAGEAPKLPDAAEHQRPEAAVVKKLLRTPAASPSVDVLREAAEVASESDVARRHMVDAGVLQRVLRVIVSSAREVAKSDPGQQESSSLEITRAIEAGLDLVRALAVSGDELRPLVVANSHVHDLLDAVTDVLVALEPAGSGGSDTNTARTSAVRLLDSVTEAAGSAVMERLRPELFRAVTAVVRDRVSPGATRSALRVLLHACPLGRNRALAVDAGAVHEAIELELDAPPSSPLLASPWWHGGCCACPRPPHACPLGRNHALAVDEAIVSLRTRRRPATGQAGAATAGNEMSELTRGLSSVRVQGLSSGTGTPRPRSGQLASRLLPRRAALCGRAWSGPSSGKPHRGRRGGARERRSHAGKPHGRAVRRCTEC